ncbi:aminotransferase class I/II-fold pyridoxal phosphate-dependent enzyme [Cecembia sp.]|uniref:pyridoxal phosphate-dependent aminotransferase n=1 Tax=Cecembia sp. TaxID=1898110 RepID=UPI0025C42BB7|nr:aminotransferase class I/II-fold pyridoxal phosphate-dependent enzyme [Cecembia sp.]
MISFSNRVHTVEEYYFSQKLKEVKRLQEAGKAVINMGIGSPDLPPHPTVVAALTGTANATETHGYQNYQGIPALRRAFVDFYEKKYGVTNFTDTEVLPLIGSKEGILHISMAFLNEGDAVLVPDPGYPTYTSVLKMLGNECIYYSLNKENAWYPDLQDLEKKDLSRVKMMWINYPHMPTGAKADRQIFKALVDFAKAHDLLLVNDNPYSMILTDEPRSIFQIPGAKMVALELNSLSKTANMAGWRVGAVLGQGKYIDAIVKVKSNVDSGMFLGIQNGAIAALNLGEAWYSELNAEYAARRKMIWELVKKLGLEYSEDAEGMFVWAKLPDGIKSREFVDGLLENKSIFMAPGDIFGNNGEGWVRLSLCVNKSQILEAINRI